MLKYLLSSAFSESCRVSQEKIIYGGMNGTNFYIVVSHSMRKCSRTEPPQTVNNCKKQLVCHYKDKIGKVTEMTCSGGHVLMARCTGQSH